MGKHISGNGRRRDLSKPAPSQRAIANSPIAQGIFGSTTTEDTIKQFSMQISSPFPQTATCLSLLPRQEASYIEAFAEDEVIMSEEVSSRCLVLFTDSDTPVVLPVPRTVDEFRRNEEIVEPEWRSCLRGKFRQSSFSTQPAFVNPGLRPSQRESQVRDALERYSIFSKGARTDGPDFTPVDWGAELPLQASRGLN